MGFWLYSFHKETRYSLSTSLFAMQRSSVLVAVELPSSLLLIHNSNCTILHAVLLYNYSRLLLLLTPVSVMYISIEMYDTSTCYCMAYACLPLTSNSHASSSEVQYRITSTPAISSTPGIISYSPYNMQEASQKASHYHQEHVSQIMSQYVHIGRHCVHQF